MATEFGRIKQAVEAERTKKLQGEARITSLNDEATRIYQEIEKETGKRVTSKEEVEAMSNKMKQDIETAIMEMKNILDAEGVAY